MKCGSERGSPGGCGVRDGKVMVNEMKMATRF